MIKRVKLMEEFRDLSLLFVDDEEPVRDAIGMMFEGKVKELYLGENGQVGLELFRKHQPDVVISDIKMPLKDGLSMSHEILEEFPDARIVIVSAFGDGDYLVKAVELGVSGYLMKPLDRNAMFTVLNDLAHLLFLEKENEKILDYLQNLIDFQDEIVLIHDQMSDAVIANRRFFKEVEGFVDVVRQNGNKFNVNGELTQLPQDVIQKILENPENEYYVELKHRKSLEKGDYQIKAKELALSNHSKHVLISCEKV